MSRLEYEDLDKSSFNAFYFAVPVLLISTLIGLCCLIPTSHKRPDPKPLNFYVSFDKTPPKFQWGFNQVRSQQEPLNVVTVVTI